MNVDSEKIYAPDIYQITDTIGHVKRNWMRVKILVWNFQSLNIEYGDSLNKMTFVKELIAKTNPEIIFLIDIGAKVQQVNIVNYRTMHDDRNLIGIRMDVKDDAIIEKHVFKMKTVDLNFAYVRPMEKNSELVQEVCDLLKNGKTVIGDLNLKSNHGIRKNIKGNQLIGEFSEQIVLVKKNVRKYGVNINLAPSDHKAIIFDAYRRISHSSQIKLKTISVNDTKKAIRQIFEQGKYELKINITPVKKIMPFNEEKVILNNILDEFANNEQKGIFKRFNYLWKGFKKEPFLGTTIPKKVEQSLKVHYRHKDDKEYVQIPDPDFDLDMLDPRYPSHSSAANNENFKLCDIDKNLNLIWHEILEQGDKRQAIRNFINYCNHNVHNMKYTTFFLRKNKELNSFNDVRIISIVPIFLKIWENLIYDRVTTYLSNIIDSKGIYQYGGKAGGSTYETLFEVQNRFQMHKARGLLFLDLAKGYDSINWEVLEQDFDTIEDSDILRILKIWFALVRNTDAKANDEVIKKTRGVGMGVSLAPIVFEFYVHRAIILSRIDTQLLCMYVDDLVIIIRHLGDINSFKVLKSCFERRELMLNINKSCLLSIDAEITKQFADMGIERKNTEKYLGIILGLNSNNELITDNRYFKLSGMFSCIPKLICFAIKRRIVEAALIARTRYHCMMFSLSDNLEKAAILRYLWKNFKKDFFKLSYVQLILFMFNWVRFVIDLKDMRYMFEELKEQKLIKDFVKQKLMCGIPQWDDIIKIIEFEDFQIPEIVDLWEVKKVAKDIWSQVKKAAIHTWKLKKMSEGVILPKKIDKILNSKLFASCKICQAIVLRHYDNKNYNFLVFIVMVWTQMVQRIKKNIDVDKEFSMIDVLTLKNEYKDNEELVTLFFNATYEFLDECAEIIIEQEDKKVQRQCQKILLIMDEISGFAKNYKITVKDLLYKLNLKLAINEDYLKKSLDILDKDLNSKYYEVLDYSPEDLDKVISVDGSFANNKIGAGILIRYKIEDKIQDAEKYYITIDDKYNNLRNVAGEIFAVIQGLQIIARKGWKQVNIIFDYIGLCLYIKGVWKSNDQLIKKYHQQFWKIINQYGIKVSWFKVFSHTKVRINDVADELAKSGALVTLPDEYSKKLNFMDIL